MQNKNLKLYINIFLCLVIFLGFFRFIYATSIKNDTSLFKTTYFEKRVASSLGYENQNEYKRLWGPASVVIITSIDKIVPKESKSFSIRVFLFISYAALIFFLINILSEFKIFNNSPNFYIWYFIIVFIMFQSSAAIYNINNGGGEIITSLSIIGHFYFFYKKKYLIAAIFIIFGIYFKLHPVVFAFPYFVFAVFSINHRKYLFYLIFIGFIVAIISYFIQGLKYGSLYPISIIFSILNQSSSTIPIWSQEIFNPLSLINKLLNDFNIENSFSNKYQLTETMSLIIIIFTVSFILINIILGIILSKLELQWNNNNNNRLKDIFLFQVVIGFFYLIFSLDISIEHLLNSLITIYAPIFLFSINFNSFKDLDLKKYIFILFYIIGLSFTGLLIPISILNLFVPYELIDKIIGYNTASVSNYGKFIWYHFPLLGIFIISIVSYYYYIKVIKKENF